MPLSCTDGWVDDEGFTADASNMSEAFGEACDPHAMGSPQIFWGSGFSPKDLEDIFDPRY